MSKLEPNEEQTWYIYTGKETKGPFSLRDLDVLLRTNQINSRTFGWKNEMKDWKPLNEIEEIKQNILDSSNELLEIGIKKGSIFATDRPQRHEKDAENQGQPQSGHSDQPEQEEEDLLIQNKDENPYTILEVTVENLLKKTFHQSQDGKWSIYDEQKQQWILQDQEPTEKIDQLKSHLFNKLKTELFFDESKKKKHPELHVKQPQENLTQEELAKRSRNRKKTKRAAEKKKEKWYNAKINTYVYISGLPYDITVEELKEFASKAGVLRIDMETGKEKIKMYHDEGGCLKGDAAISFARSQSVEIAIELLNERQIRPGFIVKVERAQFNQKNQQYKPREMKNKNKVKKILAKKNQEKQLGWEQDNEKGEGFKIVIMKHIFTPQLLENEEEIEEIKKQITEEIISIGPVKRIRFYEQHPEGVVEIKFVDDKDAQSCIQLMNGRYFDQRLIVSEYWDGVTDFKISASTHALQQERLLKLAEVLESSSDKEKLENQQREAENGNEKLDEGT